MRRKERMWDIIIFIFLTLGAVAMLYPLVWMIFTSFKPKMHVYLGGLLPQVWDFSSYSQIWREIPLVRGFLNTILYSVPPVIIGSLVSVGAAFAFAKINFKGKDVIFMLLLGTLIIPFKTIMVRQFVLFSNLNILYKTLRFILPKLAGNVMMIFFLRQFLGNVPDAVMESAKIDGANYFQIYHKIVIPLVKPALAAHGVLWFIGVWNDYLAPVIFIKNEKWQPVTVMVAKFNEQYAINTHVPRIMAGSVMLLIPVLIIYGIFQRWIVESVVFSSVKE